MLHMEIRALQETPNIKYQENTRIKDIPNPIIPTIIIGIGGTFFKNPIDIIVVVPFKATTRINSHLKEKFIFKFIGCLRINLQ